MLSAVDVPILGPVVQYFFWTLFCVAKWFICNTQRIDIGGSNISLLRSLGVDEEIWGHAAGDFLWPWALFFLQYFDTVGLATELTFGCLKTWATYLESSVLTQV